MKRRVTREDRINRIINRTINETISRRMVDEGFHDWVGNHKNHIRNGLLGLATAAAVSTCAPKSWNDDYVTQYDLLKGDIESVEREFHKPISQIPPSEYDWIYEKWGDFMDENEINITDVKTMPYIPEGVIRRIVRDSIRRII